MKRRTPRLKHVLTPSANTTCHVIDCVLCVFLIFGGGALMIGGFIMSFGVPAKNFEVGLISMMAGMAFAIFGAYKIRPLFPCR